MKKKLDQRDPIDMLINEIIVCISFRKNISLLICSPILRDRVDVAVVRRGGGHGGVDDVAGVR